MFLSRVSQQLEINLPLQEYGPRESCSRGGLFPRPQDFRISEKSCKIPLNCFRASRENFSLVFFNFPFKNTPIFFGLLTAVTPHTNLVNPRGGIPRDPRNSDFSEILLFLGGI